MMIVVGQHSSLAARLLIVVAFVCLAASQFGNVLCGQHQPPPQATNRSNTNGTLRLRRSQSDPLTALESISSSSPYNKHQNQFAKLPPGERTPKVNFTCPTQFGYFRDVSNCSAYYICSFGIALLKNCTFGLYFSERLQNCDWPTNVHCARDHSSHNSNIPVNRPNDGVSTQARATAANLKITVPTIASPKADQLSRNTVTSSDSSTIYEILSADSKPLDGNQQQYATYTVDESATVPTSFPTTTVPTPFSREYQPTNRRLTLKQSNLPQSRESLSKLQSSKYVVDGFDVPLSTLMPKSYNYYSGVPNNKSQTYNNSTFIEITNLNSSNNQLGDKSFQKRNDFDAYWSDGGSYNPSSNVQPRSNNPNNQFSGYIEHPRSNNNLYFRHRPQNEEVFMSNSNPYLPKLSNKKKPESYYAYESDDYKNVAPYRSRYQHKYQENRHSEPELDENRQQLTPMLTPPMPKPPTESPTYANQYRQNTDSRPVQKEIKPVAYIEKLKPIEINPIRRKVPELYLEVIANDAPPSGNANSDQPLMMFHPEKRLNYEINERLLAPFNKQQQIHQQYPNVRNTKWFDKMEHSKAHSVVPGVNRYTSRGLVTAGYSPPSPVTSNPNQFKKKVIRKKKISRNPQALAASSSTNLYGRTSNQLLTGSLVTHPFMISYSKQNSRPPLYSTSTNNKAVNSNLNSVANSKRSDANQSDKMLLKSWKPVPHIMLYGSPSVHTTPNPLPLFTYSNTNNLTPVPYTTSTQASTPKMSTQQTKPQVRQTPPISADKYHTLLSSEPVKPISINSPQLPPVNRRPAESIPNDSVLMARQIDRNPRYKSSFKPQLVNPEMGQSNMNQLNGAQYNRYILLPQNNDNNNTPFSLSYQDKNSTRAINRYIAQQISNNSENQQNKYQQRDIVRIAPSTKTPLIGPSYSSTAAPIRDSLEDYIKKAIESSVSYSDNSSTIGFIKMPFAPTLRPSSGRKVQVENAISNFLDFNIKDNKDGDIPVSVAPPRRARPTNGARRIRKYRPLITLDQSTPQPRNESYRNTFTSQRIVPTTETSAPTTPAPSTVDYYSYTYSDVNDNQKLINLNEPNTIVAYTSPNNNELTDARVSQPVTISRPQYTTVQAEWPSSNRKRFEGTATSTPITPTMPITTVKPETTRVITDDIEIKLMQTTPARSTTTKIPRISSYKDYAKKRMENKNRPWKTSSSVHSTTPTSPATKPATTTTTTTTSTTTMTPKIAPDNNYFGDYDNYDDYNYNYNDYDNQTESLDFGPYSSTVPVLTTPTTTTTTTTTTTRAPSSSGSSYRRPANVTSKPLVFMSIHKPRPTNRRLIIKENSGNEVIKSASRPQAVYPQPKAKQNSVKCDKRKCRLPDCRCGSSDVPDDLARKDVPQLVMLTFDDGVNDLNWELYEEIFNSGRKNPNGCPIRGTFYVSHEWTDYGQVQTLYSRGHEIASHTISHRFGEKFSKEEWIKEINGQREILNLYGGVKYEDIRGMRAPFLQTGGNNMFEMLYETNFTYDSSLPVQENSPPFWPYTLDYSLSHSCNIPPCPTKSFPGVWEVGMVMWSDLRGGRCSMGDACTNPPDEDGVYEMLIKNFNRHYKSNRAPFSLYYHSAWFNTQHHRRAFMKFLDEILQNQDVYMVPTWQVIQWMREPTPLDRITSFDPFKCNKGKPISECARPTVCNVNSKQGSRTLRTCQECPTVYPWIGNNGFTKTKLS